MPIPTLRGIAIEDPIINFGDIKENLKTRIWPYIQNGNPDQHRNAHCNVSDKGPYMSGVWWLECDAVSEICGVNRVSGKKKNNNKDSTEI